VPLARVHKLELILDTFEIGLTWVPVWYKMSHLENCSSRFVQVMPDSLAVIILVLLECFSTIKVTKEWRFLCITADVLQ